MWQHFYTFHLNQPRSKPGFTNYCKYNNKNNNNNIKVKSQKFIKKVINSKERVDLSGDELDG